MIIESPRPTRAEGLLYTVTCSVTSLLVKVCRDTPAPNEGGSNPPAQPTTPSALPAQQSAPSQVAPSPAVTQTTPLETAEPLAVELPAVPMAATNTTSLSQYQYPSSALASVYNAGQSGPAVLGASSDDAFLEATPQGWRLMGMLWYWWVLIVGLVIGGAALIRKTVTKPFLSIVK